MRFSLNGADLKPGMSLRQQAQAIAKANGAVVVTISSHRDAKRLSSMYSQIQFYSPVNSGSKQRLFICK